MKTLCRNRQCQQGRNGRYRTYHCRECGESFQTPDILINPLPENKRICPDCRRKRGLDLAVMVAVHQGVYWRKDAGDYMSDAQYQDWLDEQKGETL